VTVSALQEVKISSPELRGASLALGSCRDLEVCLDGPAGTGKTYGALFKIHMELLIYPGAKALLARKTNTALAGSATATYRELLDPREGVRYFGGNKIRPAAFEYPNGSTLVVNGLDKPDKVKSWEFDRALINEATECEEEDIEFVRSRLRHGKMPYHQLILDVNPGPPEHWLNQRMNAGTTTRLLSRHEDNPRFYDAKAGQWTEEGYRYIFEILGGLTGVRLARLRYGIWSAATGTVYEDSWDRARNVIPKAEVKPEYPRYLVIDFGFTHPFVCLWAAVDPDGRIIIYRQLYMTKRLVEDHALTILLASGWYHLLPKTHPKYATRPPEWADPLPRDVICDHDAEDRATFERHTGLYTTPAKKTVSDGIQATASRFRAAGDGKPRFMVMRDCLIERDMELARAKKPTCLEEEPDSYVWRQDASGAKEEPVKENDHALDASRYLCAYFDLTIHTVSYIRNPWS
jgi:phage terminase large subunit